ncbi:carboxymuconolactone decarboxylase family protein [Marimonas arenosa]|uniref:Carboxymuconolactone decarboxylase family protein n=1 Tax=Marimonas arenosa TaxID=1795305 RepID=A0AAE3W994_9RHOB|nr:carboxymuconolactone decarboxylase family protein [Marimonas arenosa]MDQ2088721.1 carboxymuconolactone decarboxylase family protein [Marimonas arenosa]
MDQIALDKKPINLLQHASGALPALQEVENWIANSSLDRDFVHLLKLRASQMNECAYCVKMHTRDARDAGEKDERLDHLVIWRYSPQFSDAEKAALAWMEAMTSLKPAMDYGSLRGELRRHYDDAAIAALTLVGSMINLWNRVQVSNH